MAGIRITSGIFIDEAEIEERFIQASGPGGQNVNKVATAVQLRFHAARSLPLSGPMFARLRKLSGRRMTRDGDLVIIAQRYRSQERNRADARERLAALIRQAALPPKPRVATRPGRASKERRLQAKSMRGDVKRFRVRPQQGED
ncbi:MAG: alternative ribosome rescue aminoacyl-tRNA hydrolase ArfB [Rhodomicrobium sp.]